MEYVIDQNGRPNHTLKHGEHKVPEPVDLIDKIHGCANKGDKKRKADRTIPLVDFYKVIFAITHNLIVARAQLRLRRPGFFVILRLEWPDGVARVTGFFLGIGVCGITDAFVIDF